MLKSIPCSLKMLAEIVNWFCVGGDPCKVTPLFGGSESHPSGCLQPFAPKFCEVVGPTNGTLPFYKCRFK